MFPAPEEFTVSGNGPLYAQILRDGGPEHWAVRMSVQRPRRRQGVRAWGREFALETLRSFVRGRKSFPPRDVFSDNGYRGLHNWLQKNGGLDFWASEVGLPRA